MSGLPLQSQQGICFLPSRDLDRSREFFTRLGVTIEDVTPFAFVLRAGSTMVRVTLVGDYRPQPFTVLGWQVDDIASVLADFADHDVVPLRYEGLDQDDAGIWTTPDGSRIAWFNDPDGNVLSLTQFAV